MEIHYSRKGLLEILGINRLAAQVGVRIKSSKSGKYYCHEMLKKRVKGNYQERPYRKDRLTEVLGDIKEVVKGVSSGTYTPSQN